MSLRASRSFLVRSSFFSLDRVVLGFALFLWRFVLRSIYMTRSCFIIWSIFLLLSVLVFLLVCGLLVFFFFKELQFYRYCISLFLLLIASGLVR